MKYSFIIDHDVPSQVSRRFCSFVVPFSKVKRH